jgi:hypothetical protein
MHDTERDRIFGDWLASHRGILFKVVHAYAFEHADRQDLFQEIAIQLWRSVERFRGESSVPTWIYRVALNTAILVTVLLGGIGGIAIILLGYRVNQKPFSDDGYIVLSTILMCVVLPVAAGVWELRRSVQRDILPRKHRLEALLRELDAS